MRKTGWFPHDVTPVRPGVYLVRRLGFGRKHLLWWRAFDGTHWHYAKHVAADQFSQLERESPSYDYAITAGIMESNNFEWRGVLNG